MPKHQHSEVLFKISQLVLIVGGDRFGGYAGNFGDNFLNLKHTNELLSLGGWENPLGGARLINDINRFVRKVAIIDIAFREFSGAAEGRQGILHLMMFLEFGFQSFKDLEGFIHTGLRNINLLESTSKCPVLFKNAPILLIGRGTDAAELSGS